MNECVQKEGVVTNVDVDQAKKKNGFFQSVFGNLFNKQYMKEAAINITGLFFYNFALVVGHYIMYGVAETLKPKKPFPNPLLPHGQQQPNSNYQNHFNTNPLLPHGQQQPNSNYQNHFNPTPIQNTSNQYGVPVPSSSSGTQLKSFDSFPGFVR